MDLSSPPSDLTTYLESYLPHALTELGIPGAAIGIVEADTVRFTGGFGVRELHDQSPVDSHTVFAVGSTTKAMTAALLGTLVDEGKAAWDVPVATYLPQFRLSDPIRTSQVTLRDLMAHRTGYPRHDLVWFLADFSRQHLFDSLHHLEPYTTLRGGYAYNNLMWMVAGMVAEAITGSAYEALLSERVFDPLNMTDATCALADLAGSKNVALPHNPTPDGPVQTNFHNIDAVSPAGAVNAHILDYTSWLMFNIQQGKVDGQQIISEEAMREIFSPAMVIPDDDPLLSDLIAFPEFYHMTYALGWVATTYRGNPMLHHAGGIDGFSSYIAFLPNQRTGVAILTNLNGIHTHLGIAYDLLDRLSGAETTAWLPRLHAIDNSRQAEQDANAAGLLALRKSDTQPSQQLNAYAGLFTHPSYGTLSLDAEGGQLKGSYNHLPVTLSHFHYDTFIMSFTERYTDIQLPITFSTNLLGEVERLTIPLEEHTPSIEFKRVFPEGN